MFYPCTRNTQGNTITQTRTKEVPQLYCTVLITVSVVCLYGKYLNSGTISLLHTNATAKSGRHRGVQQETFSFKQTRILKHRWTEASAHEILNVNPCYAMKFFIILYMSLHCLGGLGPINTHLVMRRTCTMGRASDVQRDPCIPTTTGERIQSLFENLTMMRDYCTLSRGSHANAWTDASKPACIFRQHITEYFPDAG